MPLSPRQDIINPQRTSSLGMRQAVGLQSGKTAREPGALPRAGMSRRLWRQDQRAIFAVMIRRHGKRRHGNYEGRLRRHGPGMVDYEGVGNMGYGQV
jgi:hypothetical protein